MPLGSLKLLPGVNVEKTPTLNQAGISSSNLIRFWDNLPQKLGGWEKFYPFPIASYIRQLLAWQDLNGFKHLAVGAEASLSVITNGVNNDITPRTRTVNLAPDFTTVSGSDLVTIVDAGSSVTTNDYVFLATPVSVGGLILEGLYPIAVALGANSYQIRAATNATTSESNAGTVPEFTTTAGSQSVNVELADHGLQVGDIFDFFISTTVGGATISGAYAVITVPGLDDFTINISDTASASTSAFMNGGDARLIYYLSSGAISPGAGYGLDGYGLGGYGTGVTPAPNPGTPITATDWSLANWGEILLANPENGAIYYWQPNGAFTTATLVGNAPLFNGGMFIAMPSRILVAWASTEDDAVQDPLLVRWSSAGNFNIWTADVTNQAGQYRIPTGSKIVGGLQAAQQAMIWTDQSLWFMNYIGYPNTFGFTKVSDGVGLIGKDAAGVLGTKVYWMGMGGFYFLTGGAARPIECPVWDAVFQDLDIANVHKIVCAPNSMFNEVTWYYPSKASGSGEPDKYVKFSEGQGGDQQVWDIGTLQRTAWIDQSILEEPIGAAGANGMIFQHEISQNADGAAMNSFFESGEFLLSEGNECLFIDWLLPDFKYGYYNGAQNAAVQFTIYTREYPNSPRVVSGPYTFTQAINQLTTRARGRQAAIRVESGDLNSFWRLGDFRYRAAPDGRR